MQLASCVRGVSAVRCASRDKKVVDQQKEEMWEAQQEILRKRREGKTMEGVAKRRAEAKEFIVPELDASTLNPYGEEDEGMQGGIPLPMAPFGIPKFDNGERFDLKAPYTDVGWVDEEDKGPFGWLKNPFGGKDKKKTPVQKEEPSTDSDAQRPSA